MSKKCMICARPLREGETAWASDWTVLDASGEHAQWRRETRYTCEECEEELEI